MTRLRVADGCEVERVMVMGKETIREAVYRDGTYLGEVVYISRRRKAPAGSTSSTGYVTEWGWRPDGWRYSPRAALTSRTDAIARLRPVA